MSDYIVTSELAPGSREMPALIHTLQGAADTVILLATCHPVLRYTGCLGGDIHSMFVCLEHTLWTILN